MSFDPPLKWEGRRVGRRERGGKEKGEIIISCNLITILSYNWDTQS